MNGKTMPSSSLCKEEQLPGDFLPCFGPSKASPVNCWAAFTALFQPHQQQSEPALQKEKKPQEEHESYNTSPPPKPPIPFTTEESQRLSKILQLLSRNYQERTGLATAEIATQEPPPFFFELAKAAAAVAYEAATNHCRDNINEEEDTPTRTFADDPEAAIQRLLQAGKRNEIFQQRQTEHLQRVETLVQGFPNQVLQNPFPACWTAIEEALASPNKKDGEQKFKSVLASFMGPHDDERTLGLAIDCLGQDDDDRIYSLMLRCCYLAVAQAFLVAQNEKQKERIRIGINVLAKSENDGEKDPAIVAMWQSYRAIHTNGRELENFRQWHRQHSPSMLSSLALVPREILFPSFDDDPCSTRWLLPSLSHHDPGSILANPSWLFAVACTLPPQHHEQVGPMWHCLFSSHSHGFNLSTLEHSLTGYRGPTVLLVEAFDKVTKTNRSFGAFASQPWTKQSSPVFYGDGDSFLFQLQPQFRVWRSKKAGPANCQYFYYENRLAPTLANGDVKKHENGLGLGGSRRSPRFFVSASLETCHLGFSDATFEDTSDDETAQHRAASWDLHTLEVWGVGGDSALRALTRHRSMEEANLQKARQVDKAAFLNDFRSGLIESKMFGHREEMRNRDGGCLLDCHDDDGDGNWQIGAPR